MKISFRRRKKASLPFIAFFQALGLVLYCGLVGLFFWQGDEWIGMPHSFIAPALVLIIFVVSALISALIVLGYPFILFWERKKTIEALKLVIYTIGWSALGIFLIIGLFIIA